MYSDSHAHLSSDEMLEEIDQVIKRAEVAQITHIINICTDKKSLEKGIELAKKYPMISNVGATPPHDVEKLAERDFLMFKKAIEEKTIVALGETGLDYYYFEDSKEIQIAYLIRYMKLALEHDVALVIHCRNAFEDLFELANQYYPSSKLILHCFTGTEKQAMQAVERKWYLSFSGILTFKKSQKLRNVLKNVPLENLLVETDCPYLAPMSRRGKKNEPAYLLETIEMVANIKKKNLKDIGYITTENTKKIFSL